MTNPRLTSPATSKQISEQIALSRLAIPAGGILYLTAYNTPLELGFEEQDGKVLMINDYLTACKWMRKACELKLEEQPKAIVAEPVFLEECGEAILNFRNSDVRLKSIPFLVLGSLEQTDTQKEDQMREEQLRRKGVDAILPYFFDAEQLDEVVKTANEHQAPSAILSTELAPESGKIRSLIGHMGEYMRRL